MTDNEKRIHHQLTALSLHCPELRQLEKLLGIFNLFRVLRFEHGEIRHSNVLGWLLQPKESHGLGDLFLRQWLKRVFHQSESGINQINPAEIDSLRISSVDVRREWNHIDLLVLVNTTPGSQLVFAIENKVNAGQGDGQLKGYRARVENVFALAEKRLYIFLTYRNQQPESKGWTSATYAQVHNTLEACVNNSRKVIANEPRVLLGSYLRLLKESFMGNQNVAELARKIDLKHRAAIDAIIEHRIDPIEQLTEALRDLIIKNSANDNVELMVTKKGIVRFIPKEWDSAINRNGRNWAETDSAYVLCEINIEKDCPWLEVVDGQSPKSWRRELLNIAQRHKFPIERKNSGMTKDWMRVFAVRCSHPIDYKDFDAAAKDIWLWCRKTMKTAEFRCVIEQVAKHLKRLKTRGRKQ